MTQGAECAFWVLESTESEKSPYFSYEQY